jgi:hypothetical protein
LLYCVFAFYESNLTYVTVPPILVLADLSSSCYT